MDFHFTRPRFPRKHFTKKESEHIDEMRKAVEKDQMLETTDLNRENIATLANEMFGTLGWSFSTHVYKLDEKSPDIIVSVKFTLRDGIFREGVSSNMGKDRTKSHKSDEDILNELEETAMIRAFKLFF